MAKLNYAGSTPAPGTYDAEKIRKIEQLKIRPAVTVYKEASD